MGQGKRGSVDSHPVSDAARGRAQPYLPNREEEEDGVSHRKPRGRILRQLNHQDSLQISEAAGWPCQLCVLQPRGLWHLLWVAVGPRAWLSGSLFLKQDWYVLG